MGRSRILCNTGPHILDSPTSQFHCKVTYRTPHKPVLLLFQQLLMLTIILKLPICPRITKKVHLNSLNNTPISPYRNGNVCHNRIRVMMKIRPVTTIWMGFVMKDEYEEVKISLIVRLEGQWESCFDKRTENDVDQHEYKCESNLHSHILWRRCSFHFWI